ncbi:bifunctional 4-hydroxy-2-oxoglutarate aldolase/2-dehydro-3-deoxy-phosphogluconate aldolase [Aquimarina megaterium]|uniref:bifunctional 4-hydroxy-2-oxoglutarate aldolase/2-dehydro-3-deoxy-phosphogluconate aldolase n=1 Tax=Aquimarina megaterium TaxID=1443666 RepID=UPI000472A5E2|nr:bifunctional 4-hydroxy-2-oxoglutarate aldolase/2-dehydro-3-deoxy-phosphogluconate aldolase [Aquimarina megaterium]
MNTLGKIFDKKAIAVIRSKHEFEALKFIETIIEGGISCIEITMTTPNALAIIQDMHKEFGNSIVLGAGTILSVEEAKKTIDAGANFIVTPISDFNLIEYVKQQNIVVMAGAFSPTEIYNCHVAGADIVKVFPANSVGVPYFKSLRGPFPNIPMMPTGGVTIENAKEWIQAGANAIGIGSTLFNDKIVIERDLPKLKFNAEKITESLKNINY